MGGNPYDPLTTTNSSEELTMADANLKASTALAERHIKRNGRSRSACWIHG